VTRLSGKRAIVTGAASGIGRATLNLFVREGARVLAVDRAAADLDAAVAEAGTEGGIARAAAADAGDERAVAKVVARCVAEWGGVDVAFANAGVSGGRVPLLEGTVEQWQEILRVNLIGPWLLIKHAAPVMIQQRSGAIVCTASVAGLRANAGGTPYSASKAGVISLVQTTSYSLTGTGIRVNAICPGLIETGMTRTTFERARERGTSDKIGQINPTQRGGQPHEIAAMGLFLASDEASYVNGQAFPVDGGLTASMPFAGKLRK
jgi:NAD(P)-dependent dehydrogenase (short-subunit alcohol dehydrogenase family)